MLEVKLTRKALHVKIGPFNLDPLLLQGQPRGDIGVVVQTGDHDLMAGL